MTCPCCQTELLDEAELCAECGLVFTNLDQAIADSLEYEQEPEYPTIIDPEDI